VKRFYNVNFKNQEPFHISTEQEIEVNSYQVQESEVINSPPAQVYAIISDYHEGHPAILPSRYFTEMAVTAGGRGEGPVTTVAMNVFSAKILYELNVTEPEPGRVLVE
jgi:hypothetical protein